MILFNVNFKSTACSLIFFISARVATPHTRNRTFASSGTTGRTLSFTSSGHRGSGWLDLFKLEMHITGACKGWEGVLDSEAGDDGQNQGEEDAKVVDEGVGFVHRVEDPDASFVVEEAVDAVFLFHASHAVKEHSGKAALNVHTNCAG